MGYPIRKQQNREPMAEAIRAFVDWYKIGYHKVELIFGIFAGVLGGFIKYMSGTLLDLGTMGQFMEVAGRTMEAIFVAFVCAIAAGAGTYVWKVFKEKYLIKTDDKPKKRKR